MAQTKEEYAALDRLIDRILRRLKEGVQVTAAEAWALNTPFPYGKTGRTKTLRADDVFRAHAQAYIQLGKLRSEAAGPESGGPES